VAKVTASKSQRCAEWTVLPQKNVGQAEEVEGQFRECRHSTVRLGGSYGFWALLMTSVAWRIHVASNTMMGDSETNSNIRMQTKICTTPGTVSTERGKSDLTQSVFQKFRKNQ
jgi:hypothetical protein